jgi:hypothetical protein
LTENDGALLLEFAEANVADLNLVVARALTHTLVRHVLSNRMKPSCRNGLLYTILVNNNSVALWTYLAAFPIDADDATWMLATAVGVYARACVRILMQSSALPDTVKIPAVDMVHSHVPAPLLVHVLSTSTIPMTRVAALSVAHTAITRKQVELVTHVIEREGLVWQDLFPNLDRVDMEPITRLGDLSFAICGNDAILFNTLMRKACVPYFSIMNEVAIRFHAHQVERACRKLEDRRRTRVARSSAAPPSPVSAHLTKRSLCVMFSGVSL